MPTGKSSPKKKILKVKSAPKAPVRSKAKAKPPIKAAKPAAKPPTKPVAKPAVKASAKPSAPKKIAVAAPKKTIAVAKPAKVAKASGAAAEAKIREKIYTELFGPSLPKGKGLNPQGESISPEEFAAQGWSVMQFPPRTGRLSWIYSTHGLSTANAQGKDRPIRVELVMHWRDRDNIALQVLSDAVKYMLKTGHLLAPGEIVSDNEGVPGSAAMLKHFLAFDPAPIMPRALELPGGDVRTIVLLGISDAELEYAAKVRPELADGRIVLMEALRAGGVFPVTDPKRQCLTRRRDFLRIWETAFRGVRERKR